jgi:Predicted membrane protein (DUF2207) C-terminal domain
VSANTHLVDFGIVAAATCGWYVLYALARLATRPLPVRAAPATQELGAQPPAVASLLANRWELTEDAAESTLLDLAARGYLEIRQPGNDPMQTTIHLRDPADAKSPGAGLLPFEQLVLERIRHLAVGGVVPVTALTFRDAKEAEAWGKRLRVGVVAEARKLGLSRRRFHPAVVTFLSIAALGVAIPLYWAVAHYAALHPSEDSDSPLTDAVLVPIMPAIFVVVGLATYAGRYPGERDTKAGREAAAHWLGLRQWLRGDDGFAELPPAAIAVWDRYLAYGAAVGATRVASAVLGLGMGSRKLVWSSFGGTWHRVRVRYPRFWPRYGRRGWILTRQAFIALIAGGVLVKFNGKPRGFLTDPLNLREPVLKWFTLAENLALLLGVFLIALGTYKLLRNLIDLATQKAITGQVLWVEAWRTKNSDSAAENLYYFAVDDGTKERTKAWARPGRLGGQPGDTVQMTIRPWSRRVVALAVTERAARAVMTGPASFEELDKPKPAAGNPARSLVPLTTDEVGQVLSLPVQTSPTIVPGPFGIQQFTGGDGRPVLLVQYARGPLMQWTWRANARGTALPGVGDGAFVDGKRGSLKVGDIIVLMTLMNAAEGRASALPSLLSSAADRLRHD